MKHTERDWRGKAYATTRHRWLSNDLVFRSFALRKNMRGAVVKLTPCLCHRETARRAIEQARSKFLFDPTDSLRHCRFRQPKLVRSADKGARLDDLRKDRQPLKIWKFWHFDFRNNGECFYIIALEAVDELIS
jgi:hypothetical protein